MLSVELGAIKSRPGPPDDVIPKTGANGRQMVLIGKFPFFSKSCDPVQVVFCGKLFFGGRNFLTRFFVGKNASWQFADLLVLQQHDMARANTRRA
jgi:hypothetical protein